LVTITIQVSAQDPNDLTLARQFASEYTQKDAVESVVASGRDKIPVLLAWTSKPPISLDEIQLMVFQAGLADAFGALQAQEAIPFLMTNITMPRSAFSLPPWRSPDTAIKGVPAVAALIRIGPEALRAIVEAPYQPLGIDERFARIVVVSRIAAAIQDKTKAIQYLRRAADEGRLQSSWAAEALQFARER